MAGTRVHIVMSAGLLARVDSSAAAAGVSRGEAVRRVLEAALGDGAQSGRQASASTRAGLMAPVQPRASGALKSPGVPVGRGELEARKAARAAAPLSKRSVVDERIAKRLADQERAKS